MRLWIKSVLVLVGICLTVSDAFAAEIKIGFPGPVTGPVQFLGQHMKWGAELAIEEINEKGGVLGQKMAFIMEDSKCTAPEAVAGGYRANLLLSPQSVIPSSVPAPCFRMAFTFDFENSIS